MKSAVIGCLAAAFLLTFGLTITAWGGETPGAPAPGTTPKADPKVDKAEKAAALIKEQMAKAEKLLQQASDEMAKPDGKRDAKKADGLKVAAANMYVAAALAANRAAATLKEDEKQAFLDQYDKPNRDKAIGIFLELADAAKANRRWQEATGYYNKVLQIDPKNQAAVDGIKAVQTEMKTGDKTKDPPKKRF
jgi:tetratricopeptide (TPR) repeat protein